MPMNLRDILFPSSEPCQVWLLLDPDAQSSAGLADVAAEGEAAGAKAILIGGSFIVLDCFDEAVKAVKERVKIPVVLFPGSARQISAHADGLLFTSLLSGRNPQFLISEQVQAAPLVKHLGLAVLPTAYLLVESGTVTSIEFISDTKPLPRHKPSLAVAHAIAAELLGMQAVYLEAGSGGLLPVPEEMIKAVVKSVSIPVIVGGGITGVEAASRAAAAGARAIVIGTAVERTGVGIIRDIVKCITH